jgi:hypothetical protein
MPIQRILRIHALVLREVASGVLGDDVVLLGRLRRITAEVEHAPGVVEAPLDRVPTRRVR